MQKLNLDRKSLREFGLTLGAFFLVISGVFLFKQKSAYLTYSLIASCVSSIMGLVLPGFLEPVYIVWMRFASILGWKDGFIDYRVSGLNEACPGKYTP